MRRVHRPGEETLRRASSLGCMPSLDCPSVRSTRLLLCLSLLALAVLLGSGPIMAAAPAAPAAPAAAVMVAASPDFVAANPGHCRHRHRAPADTSPRTQSFGVDQPRSAETAQPRSARASVQKAAPESHLAHEHPGEEVPPDAGTHASGHPCQALDCDCDDHGNCCDGGQRLLGSATPGLFPGATGVSPATARQPATLPRRDFRFDRPPRRFLG
jgi:hypothetical protein